MTRLSEKLPVLLAVLLAAVFVRLARGMPTIPYEKVPASKAKIATRAFRKLVEAYVQTFVIFIIAILANLVTSLLEPTELLAVPAFIVPGLLAFIDGLVILSILFLVMSDVSLSRIQADMMDEVTDAATGAEAVESSKTVRKAFKNKRGPSVTQL